MDIIVIDIYLFRLDLLYLANYVDEAHPPPQIGVESVIDLGAKY